MREERDKLAEERDRLHHERDNADKNLLTQKTGDMESREQFLRDQSAILAERTALEQSARQQEIAWAQLQSERQALAAQKRALDQQRAADAIEIEPVRSGPPKWFIPSMAGLALLVALGVLTMRKNDPPAPERVSAVNAKDAKVGPSSMPAVSDPPPLPKGKKKSKKGSSDELFESAFK
jgi:hypothetical protein